MLNPDIEALLFLGAPRLPLLLELLGLPTRSLFHFRHAREPKVLSTPLQARPARRGLRYVQCPPLCSELGWRKGSVGVCCIRSHSCCGAACPRPSPYGRTGDTFSSLLSTQKDCITIAGSSLAMKPAPLNASNYVVHYASARPSFLLGNAGQRKGPRNEGQQQCEGHSSAPVDATAARSALPQRKEKREKSRN